ncbi:hypothetical protein [Saccharothrix sp. HUAS TT1]|uniref:hypothetical protein n=1 Tax=unclassified Saccharothrix TaxID=2593673 RepID=UPI00345B8CE2
MTAKELNAVRIYFARKPDGEYEFVTDCLKGVRGEPAKYAAESVVVGAVEAGYIGDDKRIADEIVAMVESEERADTEDTLHAGTSR